MSPSDSEAPRRTPSWWRRHYGGLLLALCLVAYVAFIVYAEVSHG